MFFFSGKKYHKFINFLNKKKSIIKLLLRLITLCYAPDYYKQL